MIRPFCLYSASWLLPTTRCSSLTRIEAQIKYAYLATLVGVVIATIATAYTAVRSFMVSQAFRVSRPFVNSGNFTVPPQFGNSTVTRQFGSFTGARQFVSVNPLGGFINDLALVAVIIAIFGLAWLGLALMKSGKTAAN